MNYIEKNRGFVTSHKLKQFLTCEKTYQLKYELEIPDPTEKFLDADALIVGRALDDLLTDGPDAFANQYAVIARRTEKAVAELAEQGKTPLTPSQDKLIHQMESEFRARSDADFFPDCLVKKVVEIEFGGFRLRGEFDHFDPVLQRIVDLKSCANVQTFNAMNYAFQMSYYQFLLEEAEGIKADALLAVCDKYTNLSRSRAYLFSRGTLESYRYQIIKGLEDLKFAQESGFFRRSEVPEVIENSPYYGTPEYGRPDHITTL